MTPRTGSGRGTAVEYRRIFGVEGGDLLMARLPDPLKLHADGRGEHAAIIVDAASGDRPRVVSFAELNADVNRMARALRTLGMNPGERLVWCGPNSVEVLVTICL